MLAGFLNKPRRPKSTQKQREKPAPYTDTDTLLGFIENGKQAEFRATPKFINNEDRLKLAEAIVTRYHPEERDDGPGDKEDDEDGQETVLPTPPRSPSHQTQQQWLELLLEALSPDPKAPRNLAEELIKKMGKDEMSQGPLEKQSYTQQVNHFLIFTYVIENTTGLCRDKDDMKQTLFHIAAINGAQRAIMICLSVMDCLCGGRNVHVPGARRLKVY